MGDHRRLKLSAEKTVAVNLRRQRSLRLLMVRGGREGPCPHCAGAGSMRWSRDEADPADGGGWSRAYFLRCHMCELWVALKVWQWPDPTPRMRSMLSMLADFEMWHEGTDTARNPLRTSPSNDSAPPLSSEAYERRFLSIVISLAIFRIILF
jgi:hypothetical protein